MATPAAILSILVEANSSQAAAALAGYQKQLEKANLSVSQVETSTGKANRGLNVLGDTAKKHTSTFKEMAKGLLEVTAAFEAFHIAKEAVTDTVELGHATERLTAITGLDTKTASTWIETMKIRGVQARAVNMGFITLSRNIRNAEGGSKTAKKAFDQLGISQKQLKNDTVQKAVLDVADGLQKVQSPANRAALAQQLFGRSAQALIPVLGKGSEGVKELLANTQRYGAFLPNHSASVEKAAEAQRSMELATEGLRLTIGTKLLPLLVPLIQHFLDFIVQMRSGVGVGGQVARAIGNVFRAVKDGIQWLIQFSGGMKNFITVVEVLAGAFVALKVAITAATIASEISPWMIVVTAIAAAAILIVKNWSTVGPFLANLWKSISQAAQPVVQWLVDAWPAIKKSAGDAFNAIKDAAVSAWPTIKQVVVTAFEAIKDAIGAVVAAFPTIKQVAVDVFNAVAPIVVAFVEGVKSIIPAVLAAIDTIRGIIQTVLGFKVVQDIISGVMSAVGTIVTTGWKIVTDAFNAAWAIIKAVMKAIADIVTGAFQVIKGVLEVFTGIFTLDFSKMWKGIEDIFGGAVKIIVGYVRGVWGELQAAGKFIMDGLLDGIKGAWQLIKTYIGTAIQVIVDEITGAWSLLYNAGKFILGGVEAGFKAAASAVLDVIVGFINAIIKVINVIPGVNIGKVSNPLATSAPAGSQAVSNLQHAGFASGGMVTAPGYFAGEEAPRHPEFILATNPAYRARNLGLFAQAGHALGVPGFASGGILGTLGRVATGGLSDIAGLLGNIASSILPHLPKAPHLPAWISGLPGFLLSKVGGWIRDKVGGLFGGGGGGGALPHGGSGTSGQNQALGRRMMLAAGWGPDQWPALQALWNQESGWSANAVNSSSGAYGIPQSLGHGHPYNLGDAPAQIAWGLNYIRGRYGSPAAAEAHERAFNWYRKGGIRGFARGGIASAGAAIAGLGRLGPAGRGGGAAAGAGGGGGGLPTIAGVTGEPGLPGVPGGLSIGKLTGTIANLRSSVSGLEHQFSIIDGFYNLENLVFVDPNTGALNTDAINKRLGELDGLIRIRQQIFQTWGQIVAYTQELVAAYQAQIAHWQTAVKVYMKVIAAYKKALAAISTKGLKGNALKSAQDHQKLYRQEITDFQGRLTAAQGNVTKFQGLLTSAQGDLTSGGDDRDSSFISLLQMQAERTSIAGTQAQPQTPGGGGAGGSDGAGGTTTGAATTDITGLLQTIATQAQQNYNVSQAQYKALQSFPPYAGSYATGGIVPGPVGAARTAIVHGGERIGGNPEVHLHFAPGTDWLKEFVQVEIRQSGRRDSRTATRALPGSR
jgi:phage-related protein